MKALMLRVAGLGFMFGAVAAAALFIWKRPDRPRPAADVAPLRAVLEHSAELALPDPSLSGVKLEVKTRDVKKTADELVARASELGGSAFATTETEKCVVTANLPRAQAKAFAETAGRDYKLAGAAEDMITFEIAVIASP